MNKGVIVAHGENWYAIEDERLIPQVGDVQLLQKNGKEHRKKVKAVSRQEFGNSENPYVVWVIEF